MPTKSTGSGGPTAQMRGPWTSDDVEPFSWSDADATMLVAAVAAVTGLGHGLVLGRTSDGGAVSICVLAGETKPRIYANNAVELRRRLQQLTEWALDTAFGGGSA